MNISYKSGSATNVAGNIAVGIAPGKKIDSLKTQDMVMKLKPSFYIPVWKNENLSTGKLIDSQRFMYCNSDTDDGVSFTLYAMGTPKSGMLQVSYTVQFAYPIPF